MRPRRAIAVLWTAILITGLGIACPAPDPVFLEEDTIYEPDVDPPPINHYGLPLIAIEVAPPSKREILWGSECP